MSQESGDDASAIKNLIEITDTTINASKDEKGRGVAAAADALQAGCDLNHVLTAVMQRDVSATSAALKDAKQRLSRAASTIREAAHDPVYQRQIDSSKWNVATDVDLSEVKTEADLMEAIAKLADQSVSAIEQIERGQDPEKNLNIVLRNQTDITRLVSAFYDLARVV
jgi:hypothetical protein